MVLVGGRMQFVKCLLDCEKTLLVTPIRPSPCFGVFRRFLGGHSITPFVLASRKDSLCTFPVDTNA